jgi:hypothetical protein
VASNKEELKTRHRRKIAAKTGFISVIWSESMYGNSLYIAENLTKTCIRDFPREELIWKSLGIIQGIYRATYIRVGERSGKCLIL